jgi:hypothetical protein
MLAEDNLCKPFLGSTPACRKVKDECQGPTKYRAGIELFRCVQQRGIHLCWGLHGDEKLCEEVVSQCSAHWLAPDIHACANAYRGKLRDEFCKPFEAREGDCQRAKKACLASSSSNTRDQYTKCIHEKANQVA